LIPFYILIINSTRSHPDIQRGFSLFVGGSLMHNVRNVFENDNLPVMRGMINSLTIALSTAGLATYFSALTAHGIHAYNFRGRKAAFSTILLIMLIPTQISALGFFRQMFAWGLTDTFLPLIIPAIASPAVVFFMKQYMESAVPLDIIEAARIDGANEFYGFNKIILPIMKPAIAVQAIFSFVFSWNNFFMPQLILTSRDRLTLPILIARLRSADFLRFDMGQVYMLITLSIVPAIIVYLIISKHIIGGIAAGSVKG
jgi:multiple sugar transport system permease protein